MRICKLLLLILGGAVLFTTSEVTAGDKKPAQEGEKKPAQNGGEIVVTDFNGKEHKVKNWKFTTGTVHLSWLAGEKEQPKEEKDQGKKEPGKKTKGGPKAAPA